MRTDRVRGHSRLAVSGRALRFLVATSLVTTAVVVGAQLPVNAATTTFTATADAMVQEANPSTAYGTTTALRVDAGTDPDVETYLRFAVTGLSGSVQTATLRLWVTSVTADGPAVYTTASTWSESTITWANRTTRVGTGVDDKGSIPTGAWVDFNVTSLVPGNGDYNFVLAGTSTDGIDFQSREATNKPQLVVTTTTTTDTQDPTPPGGLGAVATSATRVDLSWSASTDDTGVTGYELFRGGSLLATVGAVTTYADTTAVANTTYSYEVRAFDAAGHRSAFSNTANATTPAAPSTATFAPTADAQVQEANASTNYGTSTTLRVDAGTDPDVESYLRFAVSGLTGAVQTAKLRLWVGTDGTANGPAVFTTAGTWSESTITWSNRTARVGSGVDDKGSIPTNAWVEFNVVSLVTGNGSYDLVLAGTSTDGINFSSREATTNRPELVITTTAGSGDTENPTNPTGLSATPTSGTRIDLSWTASTDNTAVINYEVYRNGALLTTVGAVTSYADTTVVNATSYDYKLKAVDGAGNHSGFSNTASVTTPDTAAPSNPGSLNATAFSATRVDLTWVASTDNVGVTNYEIYRDDVLLTTVGAVTSYSDTTASPSTPYAYKLKAVDAAGNHSGFSNTSSTTTPATTDGEPPSDITDLSANAASATRIDLSWSASTDNIGVTNYEIYRGGVLLTTVGKVTTFADLSVSPSTPYSYQVKARDAANNRSGFSNTASATTPADTTKPAAPTNLGATAVNAHRVDLAWTASSDNVGVTGYRIYRNGSLLNTVGAVTTYSDTSTVSFTPYSYVVRAIDAATNESDPSNTASVTTPDGDKPSDPTDLAASAISGTQINLTWTASTDNVAVTGYDIYRGGTLLTSVGAVTSYSDTTAINGTQYSYAIKAFDAAGNRSGFSNNASATTPDTQDPLPPSNLVATVVTATRIDLTWTAGSDNVGVTNYEVVRGGLLLATVGNVTSYSDTSALAGVTYSYQVRAMDAAGHRSSFSNTSTVTTGDLVAPSDPTNLLATAAAYNRVDLTWTGSTDNVAVTNYEIYRGGVLLTTVGAVTSYSDPTVSPGTAYTYQVKAKDLTGNRSGFSNSSSATTPQQVVTLNPTADAHVDEGSPTTNFGTAALRVDAGTGVAVESYMLFTVSGLAGTLRHATLRLYASSGTADGPAVYTSSTNWTETGITWATRPTRTATATDDKAGISTGTWVDYDVTTLMTGNGPWSFVLAGISTDGVDFHSREGVNKPQLVITMGAAAPSPTQVDLSWTVATDDVGVTGYDLYRGSTLIASLGLVNTYSDTTVSANTTYSYTVKARDRAGNVSGASNTLSVKTPSSGGTSPVIATAGDIACANTDAAYNGGLGTSTACQQLATSNLLVNGGFAAVLALGDNQYNSGSLAQFNSVYNPTWGRVKSITHPAIGNHEYGTSNASGYFTYFGSSAGDPTKGYYSYDIGTWHVVTLNSNCTIVACTAGSAQEQWLRSDLSAHPAACTIAVTHHARWSSGHDGDNVFLQPLWQALIDGGVDVLLSGHSHNYERFAPQNASGGLDTTNGIRQFVVGTGGAFFTGVGTAHANSEVRNNNTFGIMKMTLRPTGYDWQFVRAAGGTFTDSGSTACH
jgi:chitodextrinase